MGSILQIEKIPESFRSLVETGLNSVLKRGSLADISVKFVQIEKFLSGGKTGAAVLVAKYGESQKKSSGAKKKISGTTYIRVLKIAPKEFCTAEFDGYLKTNELNLDVFSNVNYDTKNEFSYKRKKYGILIYQNVGTVATSDLNSVTDYITNKILKSKNQKDADKYSRELSLLLQKEVFIGLKKSLYGRVQRKQINFSEIYGKKISSKILKEIENLKQIDTSIPDPSSISNYLNFKSTYHYVNFIHGDLNPENVLIWQGERILQCKLIDFGEVIPKKNEDFTPLFWDFSRLMGEMILNFVEEISGGRPGASVRFPEEDVTLSLSKGGSIEKDMVRQAHHDKSIEIQVIDKTLSEFWEILEAFFLNDSSKLENAGAEIGFIARIYLSALFDFINEAKSGIKDLWRNEVLLDYFYCQMSFFFFYSKFTGEDPYKRIFGIKLGQKFYEFAKSGKIELESIVTSLEKFYFHFYSNEKKDGIPVKGPKKGARAPFKDLSYFTEEDKDFFFGREKFTEELLSAIEEKQIIALTGASGSGKSSVVHAGVIPALRKKGYFIYKFRPGAKPLEALVNALHPEGEKTFSRLPDDPTNRDVKSIISSFLKKNPKKKLFLLGDQFEELFTLTTDEIERRELGEIILDLAKEFKDQFRFFITIRADFISKLLEDSSFTSVIGDSGERKGLGKKFLLGAMNYEELKSTIEKPLKVAGLEIQEGLIDLILSAVEGQEGSLPLMEFCLHELWKEQVDSTLVYEAYKEIGEVKGALAKYADDVYKDLSEEEKIQLKKIMLQLVQPGQGTEDTRRIALVDDIARFDSAHRPGSLSEVEGKGIGFIQKLANLRLITTGTNDDGKTTIEVVHEALIREWKTLREWIDKDREFRVWQEKLRYSQKEWEEGSGKDKNLLLRGTNLITANDWYKNRKQDLGNREIEYIEKSKSYDRTKKVLLWATGIIVSGLIIGFGIFGTTMYFKAEESKIQTIDANNETKKEKEAAEKARDEAKENEKKAEKAKKEAIGAREEAKELQKLNEKKEKEIDKLIIEISKTLSLTKNEYRNASDLKRWSKYQGFMKWEDAKKKCASLGKGWRLPKKGEWQINFSVNKKALEKWNRQGYHWTSEEFSDRNAYLFDIKNGISNYFFKSYGNHVRCIR
ncbi:MAG: hypothetical protein KDK36_10315 [Leptospiraceae bacterium]|nr:hypothetical protein [Leptospiraceae bacterium]